METKIEFKTTKERVEQLLATNESCRNSDKVLTFRVFEEIAKENGSYIYIPFHLFPKFPAFATVKRVRAEIQNDDGKFLPTKESVCRQRKIREAVIKRLFGGSEI